MLDKSRFLYVEWFITFVCNFDCAYCFYGPENLRKNAYMFRRHGPRVARTPIQDKAFGLARRLGIFDYADSFRNYPMEKWKAFFTYLSTFKRDIHLSFTGGEPLTVEKQAVEIINHLHDNFDRVLIRIDTNGSIVPKFAGLTREAKITFNVSYHPSQISRDKLLANLEKIRMKGAVRMINRVFQMEELRGALDEVKYFADRGYFLNFSLEDFDTSDFTEQDWALAHTLRAPQDDISVFDKTVGKSCAYPTFGFILTPNGYAYLSPCELKSVNVVANPVNVHRMLKKEPITYPSKCVCFHQRAWTDGGYDDMDIMGQYVARNVAWRGSQLAPKPFGSGATPAPMRDMAAESAAALSLTPKG